LICFSSVSSEYAVADVPRSFLMFSGSLLLLYSPVKALTRFAGFRVAHMFATLSRARAQLLLLRVVQFSRCGYEAPFSRTLKTIQDMRRKIIRLCRHSPTFSPTFAGAFAGLYPAPCLASASLLAHLRFSLHGSTWKS